MMKYFYIYTCCILLYGNVMGQRMDSKFYFRFFEKDKSMLSFHENKTYNASCYWNELNDYPTKNINSPKYLKQRLDIIQPCTTDFLKKWANLCYSASVQLYNASDLKLVIKSNNDSMVLEIINIQTPTTSFPVFIDSIFYKAGHFVIDYNILNDFAILRTSASDTLRYRNICGQCYYSINPVKKTKDLNNNKKLLINLYSVNIKSVRFDQKFSLPSDEYRISFHKNTGANELDSHPFLLHRKSKKIVDYNIETNLNSASVKMIVSYKTDTMSIDFNGLPYTKHNIFIDSLIFKKGNYYITKKEIAKYKSLKNNNPELENICKSCIYISNPLREVTSLENHKKKKN